MPTPRYSPRCAYCKAVDDGVPCRVCGSSLVKGTIRCDTCNSFQNWRRLAPASQVTLALILSIISLLSAVLPPLYNYLTNRSETYVRVLGSEDFLKEGEAEPDAAIVVLVANNGKRASFVKSATLTFAKKGKDVIHASDAEHLEVLDKDALILPDKPLRLHFDGSMLARLDKRTKQTVMNEVLAGRLVTLTVTVEETGRDGKPFDASVPHTFKADKIYKWMDARVPS
ncbi:MAG TPA: hypothetical protein VEU30_04205 [Thermoanaerobaculia bacterium]|nr:hypothetical protein [Thermoanaerobaculia bacterium]